jgi:hypothetical protein
MVQRSMGTPCSRTRALARVSWSKTPFSPGGNTKRILACGSPNSFQAWTSTRTCSSPGRVGRIRFPKSSSRYRKRCRSFTFCEAGPSEAAIMLISTWRGEGPSGVCKGMKSLRVRKSSGRPGGSSGRQASIRETNSSVRAAGSRVWRRKSWSWLTRA